jgi:hypothetical protein
MLLPLSIGKKIGSEKWSRAVMGATSYPHTLKGMTAIKKDLL